jgi:hypothetical protein
VTGEARSTRGVLVVGMHRSGTSATTRTLNLLGLPLCIAKDLLPIYGGNPTGHWESHTMMMFNERLLHCLEARWNRIPAIDEPAPWQRLATYAETARLAFDSVHPTSTWVWKDPRNCLLLMFWRTVLASNPPVVLVLRDPAEIVASLRARSEITIEAALTLWERSMHHALLGCAGAPTFVVHYGDLLERPHEVCHSMTSFLIEVGIPVHGSAGDVSAFLDPRLRHHKAANADRVDLLTPRQRALLQTLNMLGGPYAAFKPPDDLCALVNRDRSAALDNDWQDWFDLAIRRGCRFEDIRSAAIDGGLTHSQVNEAFRTVGEREFRVSSWAN